MTIVDSMRDALEQAKMNGIEPSAIELGLTKWRQWVEFAHEAWKEAQKAGPTSHTCTLPGCYTFGGVIVRRGDLPGIAVA